MWIGNLAFIAIGLASLTACSNKSKWDRSELEHHAGICGDGSLDFEEQCDDTNTMAGDGCSDTCRLESGFSCRPGQPCQATFCEVLGGAGPAPVYLRGNFLEMGLGDNAAFGAGELAPAGWHARGGENIVGELGFVSDPNATGWVTYDGDFFVPGSPEEGWGLEVTRDVDDGDGGTVTQTFIANNNREGDNGDPLPGSLDIPGAYDTPTCQLNGLCRDRGGARVKWSALEPWNDLQIEHEYTIVDGGVFIIIDVDVTNVGKSDLANIYYMRNVDPDNNISVHGDYTTTNTIISQPDALANIALVRADQSQLSDPSAISLVADDPRARVAFGGFSNRVPSEIWAGLGDGSGTPVGIGTIVEDVAISIAFKFDLLAGETTHLRYAYNLEADAVQALQCAVPCGDGALDMGEQCDDANAIDGDGCTACSIDPFYGCDLQPSVCTPVCGDGVLVGTEACDDMGTIDGDGCSAICVVEVGWTCDGEPSASNTTCGDGIRAGGEGCDDGDVTSNDGCSAACAIETGWSCETTGEGADVCTPICGDGLVEGPEQCDDGSDVPDDGCSPTCEVEFGWTCDAEPSTCTPICGDGYRYGTEACDDANGTSGDGCSATCVVEPGYTCTPPGGGTTLVAHGGPIGDVCTTTCGDGIPTGAEACDDGGTATGDGCDATCAIEPGYSCTGTPSACTPNCGDGTVGGSEACDDGNLVDGDGCTATCAVETGYTCTGSPSDCDTTCGDGIRVGLEACDDGGVTSDDGCDNACTVEPGWTCTGITPDTCRTTCGDGAVAGVEACDDGNTAAGDGCSATCGVEDRDDDGIFDHEDNCLTTPNGQQDDLDSDQVGDACDRDSDGDGIPDEYRVTGGGGCSTTGGGTGAASLGLLVGMTLFLRRRRRAAVAVAVAIASPAAADTAFSVERFRMAVDRDGVIGVESGAVQEHLSFDGNVWFGYANDPLIVVDGSGNRAGSLVTTRTTSNVTLAVSLLDRIALGAELPVILDQSSATGTPDMLPVVTSTGFGDIRLFPKVNILNGRDMGIDLAIIPAVTLPSGGSSDYRGDDGVTFAPEVAASKRVGDLRFAANLGYRMRKRAELNNLVVDDETFGAIGVAYTSHPIELSGAFAFATAAREMFGQSALNYSELQGAATIHVVDEIAASIIGGVGVSEGFGTPDWRLVLAARIAYDQPKAHPATHPDANELVPLE